MLAAVDDSIFSFAVWQIPDPYGFYFEVTSVHNVVEFCVERECLFYLF